MKGFALCMCQMFLIDAHIADTVTCVLYSIYAFGCTYIYTMLLKNTETRVASLLLIAHSSHVMETWRALSAAAFGHSAKTRPLEVCLADH